MEGRAELVQKLNERMIDLDMLSLYEEYLKKNEIEFTDNNINYRVRRPTLGEKELLRQERNKKFSELLQNKSLKFQEELIKEYESRGINLRNFDRKVNDLQKQINLLKETLANTNTPNQVADLEKQIKDLYGEQIQNSLQKNDLLQYSIENELKTYINTYITWLLFEKNVDNKWEKVFENHKQLLDITNSELISRAFGYAMLLCSENELSQI